jgi:hypothetical protein
MSRAALLRCLLFKMNAAWINAVQRGHQHTRSRQNSVCPQVPVAKTTNDKAALRRLVV